MKKKEKLIRLSPEDVWVSRSEAPLPDLDLESEDSFIDKRKKRLEQYKQYNKKRKEKKNGLL